MSRSPLDSASTAASEAQNRDRGIAVRQDRRAIDTESTAQTDMAARSYIGDTFDASRSDRNGGDRLSSRGENGFPATPIRVRMTPKLPASIRRAASHSLAPSPVAKAESQERILNHTATGSSLREDAESNSPLRGLGLESDDEQLQTAIQIVAAKQALLRTASRSARSASAQTHLPSHRDRQELFDIADFAAQISGGSPESPQYASNLAQQQAYKDKVSELAAACDKIDALQSQMDQIVTHLQENEEHRARAESASERIGKERDQLRRDLIKTEEELATRERVIEEQSQSLEWEKSQKLLAEDKMLSEVRDLKEHNRSIERTAHQTSKAISELQQRNAALARDLSQSQAELSRTQSERDHILNETVTHLDFSTQEQHYLSEIQTLKAQVEEQSQALRVMKEDPGEAIPFGNSLFHELEGHYQELLPDDESDTDVDSAETESFADDSCQNSDQIIAPLLAPSILDTQDLSERHWVRQRDYADDLTIQSDDTHSKTHQPHEQARNSSLATHSFTDVYGVVRTENNEEMDDPRPINIRKRRLTKRTSIRGQTSNSGEQLRKGHEQAATRNSHAHRSLQSPLGYAREAEFSDQQPVDETGAAWHVSSASSQHEENNSPVVETCPTEVETKDDDGITTTQPDHARTQSAANIEESTTLRDVPNETLPLLHRKREHEQTLLPLLRPVVSGISQDRDNVNIFNFSSGTLHAIFGNDKFRSPTASSTDAKQALSTWTTREIRGTKCRRSSSGVSSQSIVIFSPWLLLLVLFLWTMNSPGEGAFGTGGYQDDNWITRATQSSRDRLREALSLRPDVVT